MNIALNLTRNDFNRSYSSRFRTTRNGKTVLIEQLVRINYLRTLSGRSRIFRVIRDDQIRINGKPPAYAIDQLSAEAGSVFYPLDLEIGFDGSYLCVFNADEIRERWVNKKKTLQDYYSGKAFKKYLELMDSAVNVTEQLNDIFRRDYLIDLYFTSIYKEYSVIPAESFPKMLSITAATPPLLFRLNYDLKKGSDDTKGLIIHHWGNLEEPRTEWELMNALYMQPEEAISLPPAELKGQFDCKYWLHPVSHAIHKIVAHCHVEIGSEYETDLELVEVNETEIIAQKTDLKSNQKEPVPKYRPVLFDKNQKDDTDQDLKFFYEQIINYSNVWKKCCCNGCHL